MATVLNFQRVVKSEIKNVAYNVKIKIYHVVINFIKFKFKFKLQYNVSTLLTQFAAIINVFELFKC